MRFPLYDGIELIEIEMLVTEQGVGNHSAAPCGKAELRFGNAVAVAPGVEDENAVLPRAVPCEREVGFQHRLADGAELDTVFERMQEVRKHEAIAGGKHDHVDGQRLDAVVKTVAHRQRDFRAILLGGNDVTEGAKRYAVIGSTPRFKLALVEPAIELLQGRGGNAVACQHLPARMGEAQFFGQPVEALHVAVRNSACG